MLKTIISPSNKANIDNAVYSELYASNLYKHLANQLQRLGFFGAQKFFAEESGSELDHYRKHVEFLNDVGSVAGLPEIDAMTDKVSSLRDAIQIGYDTELQLYQDYKKWYAAAADDPVVQQFLLQFLEIQRESVGEYGDWLVRLGIAGDDKCALLIIDQEMGA